MGENATVGGVNSAMAASCALIVGQHLSLDKLAECRVGFLNRAGVLIQLR